MSIKHTPKQIEVISRGLVLCHSRILFCRNIKHNYRYLPGGHVEPGESAMEALSREFQEETGLHVNVGVFLQASELRFEQRGKPRHELNLLFHVEHTSEDWPETVKSQEDHIAFDWIDIAAIPEAGVVPDAVAAWIMAGGPGTHLDRHAQAWFSYDEADT